MPLSMQARKEVTLSLCKKYKSSTKKGKGAILDYTVEVTGWCRKHAAAVLSGASPIPKSAKNTKRPYRQTQRRGRKPKYTDGHKAVLKKVWAVLDFASSVRIKAGMADVLDSLQRCGHIKVNNEMRKDMFVMSASTIERLLRAERKAMSLKGRATTKPGTLLKSQIPIRRGSDWEEDSVGYVEIDCVAHCGSTARGEFALTLNMTDVKSGWTHPRAMKNKARVHTVEAVDYLKAAFPFDILGIDSDNGSEFINDHFMTYCKDNHILFTRGRPNTKNDGCFIEEKNWSVVRRFSAYYRFEGQRSVDILNMMYDLVALYINFFMPSQKLISKVRDGACVTRKHDKGLTPFRRIMKDKKISKDTKVRLTNTFNGLDVYELRHQIAQLQDALKKMAVPT